MRTIRFPLAAALVCTAMLPASEAWARRFRVRCHDGTPNLIARRFVCDADRTPDGTCTVAAPCPACVYAAHPCRLACRTDPAFDIGTVALGARAVIRLPAIRTTLVVRCRGR